MAGNIDKLVYQSGTLVLKRPTTIVDAGTLTADPLQVGLQGNLTVFGDLVVLGDTTSGSIIESSAYVANKFVIYNYGETGSGVSADGSGDPNSRASGTIVDRGLFVQVGTDPGTGEPIYEFRENPEAPATMIWQEPEFAWDMNFELPLVTDSNDELYGVDDPTLLADPVDIPTLDPNPRLINMGLPLDDIDLTAGGNVEYIISKYQSVIDDVLNRLSDTYFNAATFATELDVDDNYIIRRTLSTELENIDETDNIPIMYWSDYRDGETNVADVSSTDSAANWGGYWKYKAFEIFDDKHPTLGHDLDVNNARVTTGITDGNVVLAANGDGTIVARYDFQVESNYLLVNRGEGNPSFTANSQSGLVVDLGIYTENGTLPTLRPDITHTGLAEEVILDPNVSPAAASFIYDDTETAWRLNYDNLVYDGITIPALGTNPRLIDVGLPLDDTDLTAAINVEYAVDKFTYLVEDVLNRVSEYYLNAGTFSIEYDISDNLIVNRTLSTELAAINETDNIPIMYWSDYRDGEINAPNDPSTDPDANWGGYWKFKEFEIFDDYHPTFSNDIDVNDWRITTSNADGSIVLVAKGDGEVVIRKELQVESNYLLLARGEGALYTTVDGGLILDRGMYDQTGTLPAPRGDVVHTGLDAEPILEGTGIPEAVSFIYDDAETAWRFNKPNLVYDGIIIPAQTSDPRLIDLGDPLDDTDVTAAVNVGYVNDRTDVMYDDINRVLRDYMNAGEYTQVLNNQASLALTSDLSNINTATESNMLDNAKIMSWRPDGGSEWGGKWVYSPFAIIKDTTPELGGNLDVRNFNIWTSTANGSIVLIPSGDGDVVVDLDDFEDGAFIVDKAGTAEISSSNASDMDITSGSGVIRFSAATETTELGMSVNATSVSINPTTGAALLIDSDELTFNGLIWPNLDGTNQQILTTDGNGNLSFTDKADNTVTNLGTGLGVFKQKVVWDIQLRSISATGDGVAVAYANSDNEIRISTKIGSGIIYDGSGNIAHEDTSTQSSTSNTNGTVIRNVTLDTYGHVTGLSSYNLDNRYYTETESDSIFTPQTRTLTAGNGLSGGGNLTANRTFTVGAGTGISVGTTTVGLNTSNTRNTDHAAVSISAGSGLTGGGTITQTRTLSHANTSSQSSVTNSSGTVIQSIGVDGFGHLTSMSSVNLDGRYYTESEVDSNFTPQTRNLTAGNGLTGGGNLTANRTFNVGAGVGISVGTTTVALDTSSNRNTDHAGVSINAGSGLTGGGNITASRTLSHANTSSQSSQTNSGGTVIQSVGLDSFGHVSSLSNTNLDNRFVNKTGDTMTGDLKVQRTGVEPQLGVQRTDVNNTRTYLYVSSGTAGVYTTGNISTHLIAYSLNNTSTAYTSFSEFKVGGASGGTVYHTNNKPTASDVGAVSKTGDTMSGALTVNSTVTANAFNTSSSIRFKENVEVVDADYIKRFSLLEPVKYIRKSTGQVEYGFIAEKVEQLYPEIVSYDEDGNVDGLDYSKLTVPLVAKVLELEKEIKELKEKKNKGFWSKLFEFIFDLFDVASKK